MKSRVVRFTEWMAAVLAVAGAQAQYAPAVPPLPNFDVRRPAPPPSIALQGAGGVVQMPGLSASQARGIALLQQRVPGVSVSRDDLLGTPRLITASQGFLTGVGGLGKAVSADSLSAFPREDNQRVVKAFLNEHAEVFGHDAEALVQSTLKRDVRTPHNGLRTLVWEQSLEGVPVFASLLQAHVTAQEELVQISSHFLPNLTRAASRGSLDWMQLLTAPPITAEQALANAAANVGAVVAPSRLTAVSASEGLIQRQRWKATELQGDSHLQLMWLPMDRETLRLCWQVIFTSKTRKEMYRSLVDAQTGEVLVRHNLTRFQASPAVVPGTYRVYTSDSPSPFSPGWPTPSSEQPPIVPRTLLTNLTALSTVASPAGWLYPVNLNGAFETRGNNVDAHTDRDDDDEPDLPRPQSFENPPVFDFPLDLALAPLSSTNASVVNLFYLNNFMHDKLYELGFTEAAGNFQNDNFGRGGEAGDAVEADALDGADLNDFFHRNNANFYPPPDGIPGRMQMYIFDGPMPDRDGSLDSEVVCHEYTHGLSDRLVGGGAGIYALQTAGMGEGWSDFYPLCLFSEPNDDPNAVYAVGGYVTYLFYDLRENYYFGIRRYPYTTDMSKNPLTLKDIDPTQAAAHEGIPRNPVFGTWEQGEAGEVHNMGEIWCAALWDARAFLVDALGFDEGNHTILQLVTDGMKLCPVNPTYIEARNAIVQADLINYGGSNSSELWQAFARRGMGFSATCPPSDTVIGVVEAFDLPPWVVISPPDGILEVIVNPLNDATVLGGGNAAIFVRVRDGNSVTNATVRGVVNNLTQVSFNNRGTAPDTRANDSIYSTYVAVPTTGTNLTLTVNVSAPGKRDATNSVTYYIAIRPTNDRFANAMKVKGAGDVLASNNRFAEGPLESGEPQHASEPSASSSLWWSWTPTASSRALVDTGGSRFTTLLGIYTGSSVNNLREVVSSRTQALQRKGYAFFDAQKGETYRIAVASLSTNNAGQITLSILPNGQPDLTPPTLEVFRPTDGLIISSNTIDVIAQALDPGPIASGVDAISFRVSPRSVAPSFTAGSPSAGSTNTLALTEGENTITVTATDVVGNNSEAVTLTITYRRQPIANDHFSFATLLSGVSGAVTAQNSEATQEPGEPRHADNDGGKSLWWRWTAPESGALLLNTEGSTFDTLLGLYQGTRVDRLETVAANDDAFEGAGFSKLQQGVRANQTYYLAVDGFNGTTGIVQLAYAFTPTELYTVDLQATPGGRMKEHGLGTIDVPADSTQTLTAVPDDGYAFVAWEGGVVATANPVSFVVTSNLMVKATFKPIEYTDDFETANLSKLPWVTGGAAGWEVTSSTAAGGRWSVMSGKIGANAVSSLSLKTNFLGGNIQFSLRVSSEEGWDFAGFYVDGALMQQWSGELDWETYGFVISPGVHTLEWRYSKDAQNNVGQDAVYLDNLVAPFKPAAGPTSAARLSIQPVPQGQYELRIQGQTNQVYVLQEAAEFLSNGGPNWISRSTNVATDGVIRVFLDPAAQGGGSLLFRAVTR